MAQKRRSALEKQQAIFEALLDGKGRPMTAYEIHKATGIGTDSLHYHLKALVRGGILVPYNEGRYALQTVYYDEKARQSLDVALELIVTILATHTVWDYAEREKRDEFTTIADNLEFYLRWLRG